MSVLLSIRNALRESRLEGVDVNSVELLEVQREILATKPLMREVFLEIYQTIRKADEELLSGDGARIELGAGATFLNSIHSDVISTDLKFSPYLQMAASATELPLRAGSVRALYMINCFHHIPDPRRLFRELARTLAPGGGCVIVEPYYSALAGAFYRRVFDTETFDPGQREWTTPDAEVMKGANQALSYLVFKRDREIFLREFPELRIVREEPLRCWVRYLVSGGLNFRQLVPQPLAPLVRAGELVLRPARTVLALHHLIVLRKEPIQSTA